MNNGMKCSLAFIKKSKMWWYFVFKTDVKGRILNKKEVLCQKCKQKLPYSGNTTILKYHLKYQHKEYTLFCNATWICFSCVWGCSLTSETFSQLNQCHVYILSNKITTVRYIWACISSSSVKQRGDGFCYAIKGSRTATGSLCCIIDSQDRVIHSLLLNGAEWTVTEDLCILKPIAIATTALSESSYATINIVY